MSLRKQYNRKAVSPFIASVLMIAITVTIATIVGNWFKTYAQDTADNSANANDVNCLNLGVNVDSPVYNSTTNISSFQIENSGTVTFNIDKLSILYLYTNGTSGKDLRDISNREVSVGDSVAITLESVKNEFTNIRVILDPCADKSIAIDYSEFTVS